MSRFDSFIMVDWSGGNDRGPTPKADAIWTCVAGEAPLYHRNRQLARRAAGFWPGSTSRSAIRGGWGARWSRMTIR